MNKILIIEDDNYKGDSIKNAIKTCLKDCEIVHVEYLNAGLCELMDNEYDLLVLDMNMPRYEGGSIKVKLGLEVLMLFNMGRRLKHIPEIVVLSQTEDIEGLKKEIGNIAKENRIENHLKDVLQFSSMSMEWSNKLSEHLKKL